jgi:hypothetical protein
VYNIAASVDPEGAQAIGLLTEPAAGTLVSWEYINHQLLRLQRDYGCPPSAPVQIEPVEILWGLEGGRTTGEPVVLRLRASGAARRSASLRGRRKVLATAARLACATIVRKCLEDQGIFTGSHTVAARTVRPSRGSAVRRRIRSLTQASCGAYKITEEADKAEGRMLNSVSRPDKKFGDREWHSDPTTTDWIVEILFTGIPPQWAYDPVSEKLMRVSVLRALYRESLVSEAFIQDLLPQSDLADVPRRVAGRGHRRPSASSGTRRNEPLALSIFVRYCMMRDAELRDRVSAPACAVYLEGLAAAALAEALAPLHSRF